MRRVALLLLLAAALVSGCSRGSQSSAPQPQAGAPRGPAAADPAMRVAVAITALERDPQQAVTLEQARKILPWMRVLRDMRADDTEAAQSIADEVLAVLTPDQRAALERLREQGRDRRSQPGGQGGPPGGPGVGQGGPGGPGSSGGATDPARRAELRRRTIERAIHLLEAKIP